MTGKDLINFIKENKLEDAQVGGGLDLKFKEEKIYFMAEDAEDDELITYNIYLDHESISTVYEKFTDDGTKKKEITTKEALKLRKINS